MNRTDRLVSLVMMLQSRRVVTAAELAAHFEVTDRTIYRDLAALAEGGVPIAGEPGIGYSLMRGYELPPVMFSSEEATALVTGGLLTEQMTDQSVRGPMRTALAKVTAILPADQQNLAHRLREAMSVQCQKPDGSVPLSHIQAATAGRQVLRLTYRDATSDQTTERDVEPLGLVHSLEQWHLIAWCRLRNDVRDFRVNRILHCQPQPELLPKRDNFDLQHYLSSYCGESGVSGVLIEVHPSLAEMVKHHGGLTAAPRGQETDWIRYHLLTPSLEYTARWIVGLGDRVVVIEPAALAQKVLSIAEAAFRHHKIASSKSPLT